MWRKLVFLMCCVLALGLANSATGAILVHLSFEGTLDEPFPEYITDETGNVTMTAITEEIGDYTGSLTYGPGDPCYSVYAPGSTSMHVSWPAGLEISHGEQGYEMFALTGTEYTVETFLKIRAWLPNEDPYDNDGQVLIKKYTSDYYLDLQEDGSLMFQHGEETEPEGLSRIETDEGTIALNEWYHIAAVFNIYEEKPQKIYIDGEKVVEGGINVLNPGTLHRVGIAHMVRPNGSRADFVDGWMDEFRIADSALDPENFMLYGGGQIENKTAHPRPANYESHVCPEGLQLSWDPGEKTQDSNGHDVYLGNDYTEVKNADTDTIGLYKGRQDSNEYPEDGDPLLELEPNTTYCWRVDQVNDTNVWKGQVWQFTTDDGNAYDPSPIDGRKGIALDANLVWTPSCLADSQNLYFGTNPVDVENGAGGTAKGSQSPDYEPGPLEPFTWYYWRVDTVIDGNTGKGAVWSFRSRIGVVMWYKFDGTLNTDLPDPNITDTTGNVTFEKHTETSGSLKYRAGNGVYNPGGTSAAFDKAGLYRLDTGEDDLLRLDTYQYTIEAWLYLNEGDYDGDDMYLIGKDNTWALRINDLGDDDELQMNHDDDGPTEGVLTDRFDEWMHVAAVFDQTDRLEGKKLYFNGEEVGSSTASTTNTADANRVGIGCRWNVGDTKYDNFLDGRIDELRIVDEALSASQFLYPRATDPCFYNGQGGIDPNDPNDPNILTWRPWEGAVYHDVYFGTDYLSVRDAEKDDDPNNVYMGRFDTNNWPIGGNTLELELVTTYYWRIDEVNENPWALAGSPWEGLVWQFKTIYEILDPNLLLWYPFDEEGGEWIYDNSGYENHGESSAAAQNWDPDGHLGGCLAFKDDIAFFLPEVLGNAADPRISKQVTIMTWLNVQKQDEIRDNWVMQAGGLGNYLSLVVCTEEGDVSWRAGNDTNDLLVWDLEPGTRRAWRDDWHHFAFVKDENEEKMYIYFDGDQVAWKPDTTTNSLADLIGRPFKIGAKVSLGADYEGKLDNFKLYKIALSESEIKKEFRGSDLNLAWKPSPYDGQPDATYDANLAWRPGDHVNDVNGHQVFFGTSWADVNAMTDPCSVQDACEYEPGLLVLDKDYYWRIDEVNGPCTWPGPVWTFKVADFKAIDDFEVYNKTTNQRPGVCSTSVCTRMT
ncbi:MAG: LamG-like jellyroll fold domain-containing protein [Planctomycetota bacterium]